MEVFSILQYLTLSTYLTFCVAVPLSEFYSFGNDIGDTGFPKSNDDVTTLNVTYGFKFYSEKYYTLHVSLLYNMKYCIPLQLSNNGVISFITPVTHYSPEEFPVNYPAIAPFWADVDTTAAGAVWFRVTTDPEVVLRISNSVKQHFNVEEYFAYEVVVITWDRVGHYYQSTDPVSSVSILYKVYKWSNRPILSSVYWLLMVLGHM